MTTTIERERTDVGTGPEPPHATLLIPRDVRLMVAHEDFERLCAANRDLRLELKAGGELVVMSPAASDSSRRNHLLNGRLMIWNEAAKLGVAFDSSAGFTLPDGSVLGPDASWIRRDRWDSLGPDDRDGFARIVPDFVAELRSPSDSLQKVREKMRGYLSQGVRLGWLIDPRSKIVEVYRPGRDVETLTAPKQVSGGDVLPGFTLDLAGILHDEA